MEKKSSLKRAEASAAVVCRGLELHCFPDIASAEPSSRRPINTDEALFQRVVPGTGSCICGPYATASEIDGAGQNLSVEEIEKIGYQRGFCEGEQRGLSEGEKRGLKKGRRDVQPLMDSLESLLAELAQARKQTYQRLESEIVELTMAIARKIVGRELAASPEIVRHVIQQARRQLDTLEKICIKLNPEDLQLLNQENARLCPDLIDSGAVSFESEPSIACGGCVIETEAGTIDARLETQFNAIEEAFHTAMSGERDEG